MNLLETYAENIGFIERIRWNCHTRGQNTVQVQHAQVPTHPITSSSTNNRAHMASQPWWIKILNRRQHRWFLELTRLILLPQMSVRHRKFSLDLLLAHR